MKRWLWAGIAVVAAIGSLFVVLHKKAEPQLLELPVSISSDDLCGVIVEIAGTSYPVGLAIGNKFPLSIDQDILTTLTKRQWGKGTSKDFRGVEREFPLFMLPSVKLGSLKLTNVIAAPDASVGGIETGVGIIAWPFDKMGLFLDLPHRRVMGVRHVSSLCEQGYDLSKMAKVPYQERRGGLAFEVTSPNGPLVAAVDCAANGNLFHCADDTTLTSTMDISIGGHDFREIPMTPMSFPQDFKFSLILGTAFLKNHVVYIDPIERCLYFGGKFPNTIKRNTVVEVPLERDAMGCPVVQVQVGGQGYPLMLDTGFDGDIHWQSKAEPVKDCCFLYESLRLDLAGEGHQTPVYSIPECKIGGAKMTNVTVGVGSHFGAALGVTLPGPSEFIQPAGYLGLGLLERSNVYIDMVNGRLFLANTLEELEDRVGHRDCFHRIPFELAELGIVVEVDSGGGAQRYLLDSGTGITFANPEALRHLTEGKDELGNPCWIPDKFVIGDMDSRCERVYAYQMDPMLGEIDGVLGADFLRGYPLFIDYENRVLYVQHDKAE